MFRSNDEVRERSGNASSADPRERLSDCRIPVRVFRYEGCAVNDRGDLLEYTMHGPEPLDMTGVGSSGGYVCGIISKVQDLFWQLLRFWPPGSCSCDLVKIAKTKKLTGDPVQYYLQFAAGRRFISFCCNIDHAEAVALEFEAAGIPAVAIHARKPSDRKLAMQYINDVRNGREINLITVGLCDEGIDLPEVSCVIDLAPTQSRTRYLQRIRRILSRIFRPDGSGLPAVLLDPTGNWLRHGLPCWPREWSLNGRKTSAKIQIPKKI